jgi:hypothetical protein
MTLENAFIALLAFTVCREVYFLWTMNKLVNKLMCRSLHEYNLANTVYQPNKQKEPERFDESDAEDLGALQGLV